MSDFLPPDDDEPTLMTGFTLEESARQASGMPDGLIHDRYQLGRPLGHGGSGWVYAADDRLTGERVAVKVMNPLTEQQTRRANRELVAMRALRLPGVVELLDEGKAHNRRFLVMTLIEGRSFPGGIKPRTPGVGLSWADIAETTLTLTEVLHRVHEAGVVHRDLKPGNVLVDVNGRPTLLDFGLARGGGLGETITHSGDILGTPRYLAPEQIRGGTVDARADLYSLGVMLFEVLSGQPPHMGPDVQSIMRQRILEPAPPLASRAPHVSLAVGSVVDRLLQRDPARRPRTAAEVAALFRAATEGRRRLPWLGSEAPVEALVQAGRAGRSLDLGGPSGSGRTRALAEAMARLERQGHTVVSLSPGEAPFESLREVVSLDELKAIPSAQQMEMADALLTARLKAGVILTVDQAARMDRWSLESLARCQAHGSVLQVVEAGAQAEITLMPLSEADLRPLFQGPERLLHLPEDGAAALHVRTAGLPARIEREISAWVGEGLARWEGDQVVIERSGLRRLAARPRSPAPLSVSAVLESLTRPLEEVLAWIALLWPHATPIRLMELTGRTAAELLVELQALMRLGAVVERREGMEPTYEPCVPAVRLQAWAYERRRLAHLRIADLLEPGAKGRLGHLLAAGQPREIAREARLCARQLGAEGRFAEAMSHLAEAMLVVRPAHLPAAETALLVDLVKQAFAADTEVALKQALYELRRCEHGGSRIQRLEWLVYSGVQLREGAAEQAVGRVEALPAFSDPELERCRLQVRFIGAWIRGVEAANAVVQEVLPWAEQQGDLLRGVVYGWQGQTAYGLGHCAEAAAWHEQSAVLMEGSVGAISALVHAALARLEAFEPDRAEALAARAAELAWEKRLPWLEGQAVQLVRAARYRLGTALEPDEPLLDAVATLDAGHLAGSLYLTEAAIAWRAGDDEQAMAWATRSRACWARVGEALPARLASALARVSQTGAEEGAESEVEVRAEGEALSQEAVSGPPRMLAQALGLLSISLGEGQPSWHARCVTSAAVTPQAHHGMRFEVLSLDESLEATQKGRLP